MNEWFGNIVHLRVTNELPTVSGQAPRVIGSEAADTSRGGSDQARRFSTPRSAEAESWRVVPGGQVHCGRCPGMRNGRSTGHVSFPRRRTPSVSRALGLPSRNSVLIRLLPTLHRSRKVTWVPRIFPKTHLENHVVRCRGRAVYRAPPSPSATSTENIFQSMP